MNVQQTNTIAMPKLYVPILWAHIVVPVNLVTMEMGVTVQVSFQPCLILFSYQSQFTFKFLRYQ